MNYPLISEYLESIKNAEDNFATLTNLQPELNDDGSPIMSSGNFAVVFKMKDINNGKYYALKCFTREQEGRAEAYRLISEELTNLKSSMSDPISDNYLINIKYIENELFVDSSNSTDTEYPVLVMDWVAGETLDKFVKRHVENDKMSTHSDEFLKEIALQFIDFAHWISQQEIAHGDIKPDNIIITDNNKLVLVDYDGMYVPAMKGQMPRENGSPNYRHPNRPLDVFDETIDNFSLCVIAFSLAAIAINKDVYNKEIEDALVLSDKDFRELNSACLLNRISVVLHDKICSSLFSSVLMQIANPYIQLDLNTLFSLKSYLNVKPPIFLPYKIGKNAFHIYDTNSGQCVSNHIFSDIILVNDAQEETVMIVSYGGEIDYGGHPLKTVGGDYIRVTDLIIQQERNKRPKADQFALVSKNTDFSHLKWYNYIKPLTNSVFLTKNHDDKFGLISKDFVLLPLIYESINPITINGCGLFLICKNERNEYGLFKVSDNDEIVSIIDVKYDDKHWHYNNGASAPQNMIIFNDGNWKGYDLERCCYIVLPPRIKRIKAYSDQILCVETWDCEEGIRLFDVDRQSFINDDVYKTVGFYEKELKPFKDGQAICETEEHKNVIVFKDGTSYIIPYEENRLELSVNGKYVYYNEELVKEGNSSSGYDVRFTIFDYRTKEITSFIYHWNSYGMRANSVKDDRYVNISSYSMKYDMTTRVALLDLKGNPIDKESIKSNTSESPDIVLEEFDQQMILYHIIRSRFVNNIYIPNIEEYAYDVDCDIRNGYAVIRGVFDVDPEFGVYSELVGYADANRCYWMFKK